MLEKGERYDLVVMDENFGKESLMLGSTAIRELRAKLSGGEVIISCRRDCEIAHPFWTAKQPRS